MTESDDSDGERSQSRGDRASRFDDIAAEFTDKFGTQASESSESRPRDEPPDDGDPPADPASDPDSGTDDWEWVGNDGDEDTAKQNSPEVPESGVPERRVDEAPGPLDLVGGGRLRRKAAFREAHAADVQARPGRDGADGAGVMGRRVLPGNQFGRAAADVDHEAGAREVVEGCARRGEAPGRLRRARQQLDLEPERVPHRVEHRRPVCGVAEGTRARGDDPVSPLLAGGLHVGPEGVEEAVLRGRTDPPLGVDAFAQPHEPLDGVEAPEGGAVGLDDEQLGRVGTDIDRGEAHGRGE